MGKEAEYDIQISVTLDEKTFRRFARFDMLKLRKKWRKPLVFAAILVAFAAVALWSRKEQSGLIAAVLLAVGLGLPLVYFGSFLSQLNMQVLKYRLRPPKKVYAVALGESGIRVENLQKKEAPLVMEWEKIPQAFRARECIYLYVTPAKAFLLPEGQGNEEAERIWEYLKAHMGPEKCKKA